MPILAQNGGPRAPHAIPLCVCVAARCRPRSEHSNQFLKWALSEHLPFSLLARGPGAGTAQRHRGAAPRLGGMYFSKVLDVMALHSDYTRFKVVYFCESVSGLHAPCSPDNSRGL